MLTLLISLLMSEKQQVWLLLIRFVIVIIIVYFELSTYEKFNHIDIALNIFPFRGLYKEIERKEYNFFN